MKEEQLEIANYEFSFTGENLLIMERRFTQMNGAGHS